MVIFVIALLLIVVIFGVSSGMQSYASAQQAQAVIETAKAAQVSAWGNLINILALLGFVIIVLAVVAGMLWWNSKRNGSRQVSESRPRVQTQSQTAAIDVNALIQLEMIRALRSLSPTQSTPLLTDREQDEPQSLAEYPVWLSRR
jgi:flagellar basal body-associated protein FliL